MGALGGLLLALAGCPSEGKGDAAATADLSRCLADAFAVEPCARACDAGHHDKGCLTAALRAAKEAKMKGGDPVEAAAPFDRKACDGGVAEGCVRLVNRGVVRFEEQLVAAAASDAPRWPSLAPEALAARTAAAKRACELGNTLGCRWLGNFLYGAEPDAAQAAYAKGCAGDGATAPLCATVADAAKAWAEAKSSCAKGDARACTEAHYLVFFHDAARGLAAFATEPGDGGAGDAPAVMAARVKAEEQWRPKWMATPPRFGVNAAPPADAGASK